MRRLKFTASTHPATHFERHAAPRRRSMLALAAVPVVACLAPGCAVLDPNTVTLSVADLERLASRQFPAERTLLDLFQVTLQAPRLQLRPEANRLTAVLDLRARERLLLTTWTGQLTFDTGLRWDAAEQALRLDQVRVQDLAMNDPGSPIRSTAERLAAAAAERVLEGLAIYRLPPERAAELAGRGVQPGEVSVTPRGVQIRFVPLKA